MNRDLTKLEDALGEASSFAHAIHLAANGIDDGKNSCAMMMLAEHIQERLERARNLIDGLRDGRARTRLPVDCGDNGDNRP